ncbi:DUF1566 domain-containing protein [uncultured Thiodictyon sp.]|uniref:Lcl C-terminal domain-containing protein n=1 Tax=uncultured Thiodictyon sp. TaxID=1846217 RepID=UPI0025E006A5|nr:DUF1566 domain-containing protein [uncultured Thiodictyon sp.]
MQDETQDAAAYLADRQRLDQDHRMARLRTLALEFAPTLGRLPNLQRELERMMQPGDGIDYDALADRIEPALERAAHLLLELDLLPEAVRRTAPVDAFVHAMAATVTPRTVPALVQKFQQVCAEGREALAQAQAEAARQKQAEAEHKIREEEKRKKRDATERSREAARREDEERAVARQAAEAARQTAQAAAEAARQAANQEELEAAARKLAEAQAIEEEMQRKARESAERKLRAEAEVLAAGMREEGYQDNGDGTVTDPRTGLIWKRCAEGMEWNGVTCTGSPKRFTLDEIMPHGRQTLWPAFAGEDDWRIPTIAELKTLVRKGSVPTIARCAFPNTPASDFWSSSRRWGYPNEKEHICFRTGKSNQFGASFEYFVRLVRSGS